jgi:uncharacterized membrane protein (DUF4010 family)
MQLEGLQHFSPDDIAVKMAITVGIGLLVGFEREWSNKDIGVRSFALTAMLGMLSALISPQVAMAAMATALVVVIFANYASFQAERKMEITTSVALMITVVLGALVGLGHHFTPIASAIIMTMLLAWKEELHRFAGGLRPQEIRSAVLLGLLGFVIYPSLPDTFIDKWKLINPRQAWITIVIVALVGFVNYVLLRIYREKGLQYTAVLGGLVNSTATVAELSETLEAQKLERMITPLVILTTLSMFARNLLLLAIFSPGALAVAVIPILAMAFVSAFVIYSHRRHDGKAEQPEELRLGSPVSLKRVFIFGVMFVIIGVAGTLGQRYLGRFGLIIVSAMGGFVSSASTTAAAANLAHNGSIDMDAAGVATVVASITSAFVNLPITFKSMHDRRLRGRMVLAFVLVTAAGLISLVLLRAIA